ncbi:HAMP domain-containing sensor histidine kinase [Sulfurimonas sp.]|uniref:sensor histidine kinase n=1 Tax=Sulfurimonas sp. TaxID=2022749 RepID=UPI002B488C4A|nr:HAMP domain-containing sensor histidine kinase [Sulfurimonas sp.]
MLKHEKKAFIKFFITYFGSVAILILASGFFYFQDQKKMLIEKEHFSMIEHIRQLKMKQPLPTRSSITYKIVDNKLPNFNIDNFKIKEDYFEKYLPYTWDGEYVLVKKDKEEFYKKLFSTKVEIVSGQILLLLLFALISYFLALRALRPMQEAIMKLDNFSKDLIHDLNTPLTSILLNMKLLEKNSNFNGNKPLSRIKKNVENISELHNNLTTLLQEDTMLVDEQNIVKIIEDVVLTHQKIYTHLEYKIELKEFNASVNTNAFSQVLTNLISNASKYNKQDGFIKIYSANRVLCIEDNGIGIKNPSEIFNRSYVEQKSGTGIGLDITKRLCEAMDIEISATSQVDVGTTVSLKFKN